MKYIREYQVFEASATAPAALTAEQIEWLDEYVEGRWKLNRQTGLINVVGDFDCNGQGLTDLKGVRFGKVSGSFNCYNNQLTSLEGAPQSVGRSFNCNNNQLTTLVGAPHSFSGSFYCGGNPVTASTLKAIFALMKSGKSYQQALEERWPKMKDVDRVLMYKEMPSLSPEDIRKYKALATYANIKDYL